MVPVSTRSRITFHNSPRLRGSSPVVGSSRNRTGGSASRAPARSMRRLIPPEKVLRGLLAASLNRKRSISSSAFLRAALRRMPYKQPIISRFSVAVRCSSTAAYWPDKPIKDLARCGSFMTSTPATHAIPESAAMSVVRIETAVVLPAPFGPNRPRTEPVGTARSRPSSATTSP